MNSTPMNTQTLHQENFENALAALIVALARLVKDEPKKARRPKPAQRAAS